MTDKLPLNERKAYVNGFAHCARSIMRLKEEGKSYRKIFAHVIQWVDNEIGKLQKEERDGKED